MNHSKVLYLVRHGLATHSKRGYGKKKLTAPMLREGVPAIERIAEHLSGVPRSYNISSEIIRCRETSAIIHKVTGKNFVFDKRLNEDYNETIGEIRARVESVLYDISQVSQKHIIICTHGVVIAAIKNLVLNGKFVTKHILDYPLPGELLVVRDNKEEVINFN